MFKNFRFHTPHYFSKHPSRGLKELFWSVGLMDLGISAIAIFEPIFLFILGYTLSEIIFFYVMVYGFYIIILPLIGPLVGRIGYEHSILYSQFVLIAAYLFLFGISEYPILFYITPLFFALQKSLYWPAYHADFAVFSSQGQRGREVGYLETASMAVFVIGPFIGGAILEWTSFSVLFIVGAILFVLSALPLLQIKEIHSKVDISYGDLFRRLVDKQHRRSFVAYLGFGEELIVLTVWPIFIFTIVGSFLEIGILVSLATLVTGVLVLYFGRISDRYSRVGIIRIGSIIYFISWLVRGFARSSGMVLGMDATSRLSKELLFVPLEAITYTEARRVGPLIHGLFLEQSIGVGKLIAGLLAFFIASYLADPWMAIFILAGLFTLLYMFKKDVAPVGDDQQYD
ncbi:MFS transporter [Patescibacteria group bacterium]|nr:MFS transporter [Patescibacteria group bacterium]